MKILLIYPYFLENRIHKQDISAPPMGLFFVAAMLQHHGYEVHIRNWHDMQNKQKDLEAELQSLQPDVIGFSILHANRWGGLDIAEIAKRLNPGVVTVFGGIGASFLWEHLLRHFRQVDYVVIGEGEDAFLALLEWLEKGRLDNADEIPGLAYRRSKNPVRNECAAPIKNLDRLPNPAAFYAYQHVSLTRGCPGNCRFCGSPQFWGRTVRFHSPQYFVDQIEMLFEKGVRFFYFSDDTFTVHRQTAIDICRDIIARRLPITWQAISRVDLVDEDVLFWMRMAGCRQISFGVESGSISIRKKVFGKHVSDEQILNAFRWSNRYGLMSRAYFIYGSPGESWQTIEATIDLMERIRPLGALFYVLDLFPGTALFDAYQQTSGLSDDFWLNRVEDLLYFETDPDLSSQTVMAYGRKLREAFYAQLPQNVRHLELADIEEMYPLHADFLSRLAMTFDHGDYAAIDQIHGKDELAETLYRRALSYYPEARAFLGLGIGRQKAGRHDHAVDILTEGIGHYPHDPHLNMCLAVSYLNKGAYHKALDCLLPFDQLDQARTMIVDCYRALNRPDKAAAYQN